MRKPVSEFPIRSHTNQAVQSQMARGLRVQILEVGIVSLCSENKGTDQLRGQRRLFIHMCKKQVSS